MTSPGVIEHREIPEPGQLKENEVLLRIKRIGVCGSDIHVFHGKHPATPYPVVQGHEYSAIIEAVGDQAQIKGLLEQLDKFGVKELVRTGRLAITE